MKQIYNFEQHNPPALNESMLRTELERRRLRWQTAVIAAAGILLLMVAALLGFFVMDEYPWITVFCLGYVLVSATGGGVLAVVATKRGGI